ncbi:MAG TPA: hypothetical protein VF462_01890 [Micromonosporaceae bacterium]
MAITTPAAVQMIAQFKGAAARLMIIATPVQEMMDREERIRT